MNIDLEMKRVKNFKAGDFLSIDGDYYIKMKNIIMNDEIVPVYGYKQMLKNAKAQKVTYDIIDSKKIEYHELMIGDIFKINKMSKTLYKCFDNSFLNLRSMKYHKLKEINLGDVFKVKLKFKEAEQKLSKIRYLDGGSIFICDEKKCIVAKKGARTKYVDLLTGMNLNIDASSPVRDITDEVKITFNTSCRKKYEELNPGMVFELIGGEGLFMKKPHDILNLNTGRIISDEDLPLYEIIYVNAKLKGEIKWKHIFTAPVIII